VHQDQEARSRVRVISGRAAAARAGLEAVGEIAPILAASAIRPGAVPPYLVDEARKARTDLRQAATASLRGEGTRRVERLTGQSVNEALKTAENLKRQRVGDLNKAVDSWRKDNLPPDVVADLIDLPGLSGAMRIRLQRNASLLRRSVSDLPAGDLPGKLVELRKALEEWRTHKAEYDAALERENPEIKTFLARAGSDEGAVWSMVTPAVRRWLDEADAVDVVRIRLM
jgi:hypothetical protein